MSAPDHDRAAVRDILRAAEEIAGFVENVDLDGFLDDVRTQAAVLHRLIVIGEATKRLSSGFRSQHADLPWKDIAGLRDVLVHDYDRVKLSLVWTIATARVPELSAKLGVPHGGPEHDG